jgi:hypothetical protein
MLRIEAGIIVEAGELQRVELQLGRIVDQLDILPAEGPDGIRVEAQSDALRGAGVGGCGTGGCSGASQSLNEGASIHHS